MKKASKKSATLYVANLKFSLRESDVFHLFKDYGYIKNIKLLYHGKENKSRGVAFIEMKSLEDAKKVLDQTHGLAHQGRTLKVTLAENQNYFS